MTYCSFDPLPLSLAVAPMAASNHVRNVPKINASGQWVERSECVNLNELFNRMSIEEMDAYGIGRYCADESL
ncbi:MAG: hypothetical protein DMG80_05035 [Acidobacteria bacterium]|nr:MAG: hypothetical protein DMG80_05035 [Acidobacteriota bacterium]